VSVDRSKLRERLRGVVAESLLRSPAAVRGPDAFAPPALAGSRDLLTASVTSSPGVPAPPARSAPLGDRAAAQLEAMLRGEWRSRHTFVVEQRVGSSRWHGRLRIGDAAETIERAAVVASMLNGGGPVGRPLLFFDIETTGLNGGAGTFAFLVGCGWFDPDGSFVTRQYLLADLCQERPMLEAIAADVEGAGALVSFNGKSFDAPVLETRYLFHRLAWTGASLPHIDALHAARRFWGAPLAEEAGNPHFGGRSCSLTALEQHVLGAIRRDDVPGFEIPARYFRYLRSADVRPLVAVLDHNRRDLLSLAVLTARLLYLLDAGPSEAYTAREAIALGRAYAFAGLDRAREAFVRALDLPGAEEEQAAALRSLAILERRAKRHAEAAIWWRELLDLPRCPARLAREAAEALAIHHEHRLRDLIAARTFALQMIDGTAPPREGALRHRLARINQKMKACGLQFDLSSPD
jgi:uncharacterized protein YprB with RNaseH-like and TPR domain